MAKRAILVLEDGSIYEGYAFGAETHAHGEVVFNTSMTGYQEISTACDLHNCLFRLRGGKL